MDPIQTLGLRIAAMEADLAALRREARALFGDHAFGMPEGFGDIGDAYERAMGMLMPSDLADWVCSRLTAGTPARYLIAALDEASNAYRTGIAQSFKFAWRRLAEDTPVGDRMHWRARRAGQRRDGSLTAAAVAEMAAADNGSPTYSGTVQEEGEM